MYGTEYGRKNGSYSTATIGTWELVRQDTANNYSVIRSHLYFDYGGGTRVNSSNSSFGTMGVTLYSGSYSFTPGTHHLGSTDFTVYHNADGTFPQTNVGFWASSAHMSGGEVWGTIGYRAVPNIPRASQPSCITWPNTTQNIGAIGSTITIHMNRKSSSFTHTVRYAFGNLSGTIATGVGDSCQWTIPTSFYSQIPNANTGTGTIYADTYNGGTKIGTKSVSFTCNVTNSNPTFDYFEFEDIDEKTTSLTSNPQSIIKGFSTVLISIPVANKAMAKNSATMSKYRGKIGELTVDIPYSESSRVGGRIAKASSSTITCYAIDSRNNSTAIEKQAVNFINYFPVTKGNITVGRENGVSENVKLKIDGTYHNVNFGAVTNSIKTAKYRFKTKENAEWSNYSNLEISTGATGENGNFSFDGLIKGDTDTYGFNISNSYMFEVLIEDELSSVTFTANLGSGIPNIALAKQGVGIMGKYDESVGGLLQLDGKKVLTPYVLYENSSGNTGTVTLSDSVANYDFIEVYYLSTSDAGTGYAQSSTKVWQANGKTAWLTTGYCTTNDNGYNVKLTSALLSGTQITKPYGSWEFNSGSASKTNYIGITKVIGYK